MESEIKKKIRKINRFFGDVKHKVRVVRREITLIDVEYEDFLNVKHVSEKLQEIVGDKIYLNVKRECSERLFAKILKASGLSTDRDVVYNMMEEYEE